MQREVLEHTPDFPKFLDRHNTVYRELHRCCDLVYRQLHSSGVGTVIHHTETFNSEEEDKMWSTGVFSIDDPQSLQRAIFFYVGKHFCIRGGEEQRKLKQSQFIRCSNPEKYIYYEHGSKNRSGGLQQLHLQNKSVPCLAIPENRPRCLVYLLDLYLSRLPPFSFKEDIFYCRPKKQCPSTPSTPWYDSVPVGKNKLSSMVSDMCKDANIPRKTNHSLRATALFQSNIPEKIIQKTTGHNLYECMNILQQNSSF